MQSALTPMYRSKYLAGRSLYDRNPQMYHDKVAAIITQLEEYSHLNLRTVIESPLEHPALSYAPNMVKIAASIVVLGDAIVAQILAHEYGHHYYKHVFQPPPESTIQSEFEADLFSIKFLEKYKYDLREARDHRLGLLTPEMDCDECSDLIHFRIMASSIEKEFNNAIARVEARDAKADMAAKVLGMG